MEFYELWRNVMYGVGVFVMCNVGGQVLMRLMAGRKTARKACPVEVIRMSAGEMAGFEEHLRRFAENRRQVDANRTDADAESDDETESDVNGKDGDSQPYDEGRYHQTA